MSESEPCIVCGHPTGGCTADDQTHVKVFGPGLFASLKHEEMFIVTDDVFETFKVGKYSTSKRLVARRGQAIPMSKAKSLGLS